MGMTALDDADPKREDIMTMLNTFKVIKEQINVSWFLFLQISDVVVMDIHVISIFTVPRIFERYPVT